MKSFRYFIFIIQFILFSFSSIGSDPYEHPFDDIKSLLAQDKKIQPRDQSYFEKIYTTMGKGSTALDFFVACFKPKNQEYPNKKTSESGAVDVFISSKNKTIVTFQKILEEKYNGTRLLDIKPKGFHVNVMVLHERIIFDHLKRTIDAAKADQDPETANYFIYLLSFLCRDEALFQGFVEHVFTYGKNIDPANGFKLVSKENRDHFSAIPHPLCANLNAWDFLLEMISCGQFPQSQTIEIKVSDGESARMKMPYLNRHGNLLGLHDWKVGDILMPAIRSLTYTVTKEDSTIVFQNLHAIKHMSEKTFNELIHHLIPPLKRVKTELKSVDMARASSFKMPLMLQQETFSLEVDLNVLRALYGHVGEIKKKETQKRTMDYIFTFTKEFSPEIYGHFIESLRIDDTHLFQMNRGQTLRQSNFLYFHEKDSNFFKNLPKENPLKTIESLKIYQDLLKAMDDTAEPSISFPHEGKTKKKKRKKRQRGKEGKIESHVQEKAPTPKNLENEKKAEEKPKDSIIPGIEVVNGAIIAVGQDTDENSEGWTTVKGEKREPKKTKRPPSPPMVVQKAAPKDQESETPQPKGPTRLLSGDLTYKDATELHEDQTREKPAKPSKLEVLKKAGGMLYDAWKGGNDKTPTDETKKEAPETQDKTPLDFSQRMIRGCKDETLRQATDHLKDPKNLERYVHDTGQIIEGHWKVNQGLLGDIQRGYRAYNDLYARFFHADQGWKVNTVKAQALQLENQKLREALSEREQELSQAQQEIQALKAELERLQQKNHSNQ